MNGPTDVAFGTWDMLSSIGPITGMGAFLQWTLSDVNTDGGVLVFDSGPSTITFTPGSAKPCPRRLRFSCWRSVSQDSG